MGPHGEFDIGDAVRLVGMTDDSLNGLVGTLVKTAGKSRFAMMIHGREKTTVVAVHNLERVDETDVTPKPYHIVGTWDDWEPHEMQWSSGLNCFESIVTIGKGGTESFKFLVDGEWDRCVYPQSRCISPDDGVRILGPDDGGMETEWSIGLHQRDKASPGTRFKVRIFFAGTLPTQVTWEILEQEKHSPRASPRGGRRVSWQDQVKNEPIAKEREYQQDDPQDYQERHAQQARRTVEEPYVPPTARPNVAEQAPKADTGDSIEAMERAARERLAKRLERAAEMEQMMLTDGEVGVETQAKEEGMLHSKMLENKKRYVAHSGARKDREMLYDGKSLKDIEEAEAFEKRRAEATPQRTGKGGGKGGGAAGGTADNPALDQGNCIECQMPTTNILDTGGYCCISCWTNYQAVVKEGWNGTVFILGKQAAQHAQYIVDTKKCPISMARREVMASHPLFFDPNHAPKPYQVAVRQCSECKRATTDGHAGTGGLWFCKFCTLA